MAHHQVITTRTIKTWIDELNILHIVTLMAGATQTLQDAKDNVKAVSIVCAEKKYPTLIDFRTIKYQDAKARAYYAGPEAAIFHTAYAILVDSVINRAVGNTFLTINKPTIPTRLFKSESEAFEWLKGFPAAVATR